MLVSSLDPAFAWPTIAMQGGNMSAFIDETQYFSYLDDHQICPIPHEKSKDAAPLMPWLTAALTKDATCFPTLGGSMSPLVLQPNPTPVVEVHKFKKTYFPDELQVVNRSSSTVVVVSMYNGKYQAEGATLKSGQQTMIPNNPGDSTVT
jgi:hypothetical protein